MKKSIDSLQALFFKEEKFENVGMNALLQKKEKIKKWNRINKTFGLK